MNVVSVPPTCCFEQVGVLMRVGTNPAEPGSVAHVLGPVPSPDRARRTSTKKLFFIDKTWVNPGRAIADPLIRRYSAMMPNPDPRTVNASATPSTATPNTTATQPTPPLLSEFASDPDMSELIAMFVEEMPERVRSLDSLWQSRDLDNLKRIAHQLKGAGGGYGFSTVSNAAGKLEDLLKSSVTSPEPEARFKSIQSEVNALIQLCQRVKNAA